MHVCHRDRMQSSHHCARRSIPKYLSGDKSFSCEETTREQAHEECGECISGKIVTLIITQIWLLTKTMHSNRRKIRTTNYEILRAIIPEARDTGASMTFL